MNTNHRDPDKLRAFLTEDAPDEAPQLQPIIGKLREWQAPRGDSARKAHLTAILVQEHRAAHAKHRFDLREWWPVLLILSQLRVVETQIWTASALVMALGGLVTLALDRTASREGLPFALFAPLIAAAGIAFLYEPENQSVMEIERGTPASMRLIWLARLTLVFVFNVVIGIAASIALSLVHPAISAWSLVMMWLAPMALLSALAFLISIYRGEPLGGVFVSLLLWVLQVIKYLIPAGISWIDRVPNLLAVEARLWTFAAALLLLALGLWMVEHIADRAALRTE